jgi:hypothetical protein
MWSGSGNGESGIRAIGARRTLHAERLRYKISPQVKLFNLRQLRFNLELCQEGLKCYPETSRCNKSLRYKISPPAKCLC